MNIEIERELARRMAHAVASHVATSPTPPATPAPAQPGHSTAEEPLVRARYLRRVRYLVSTYQLDWIAAEWCEILACQLKHMDSGELRAVLYDLDTAYECISSGIPLEDMLLAPKRHLDPRRFHDALARVRSGQSI